MTFDEKRTALKSVSSSITATASPLLGVAALAAVASTTVSSLLAAIAAAGALTIAAATAALATVASTTIAAAALATVATTSTTVSATSSEASSGRLSIGKVDFDTSAIQLLLVHVRDGGLCFRLGAVGNEAKSTGSAGFTIAHHDAIKDLAEVTERFSEKVIIRIPTEIACRHINDSQDSESKTNQTKPYPFTIGTSDNHCHCTGRETSSNQHIREQTRDNGQDSSPSDSHRKIYADRRLGQEL